MNFSRMNSGAVAGFLAAGASGPIYALIVALAPFDGDVLDVSPGLGIGLILALPVAVIFGFVFAGVPTILTGMVLGAAIGDRPLSRSVVGASLGIGALGGAIFLRSMSDSRELTGQVAAVGAVVGVATAFVWIRLFDFLRSRKPTVIVDHGT